MRMALVSRLFVAPFYGMLVSLEDRVYSNQWDRSPQSYISRRHLYKCITIRAKLAGARHSSKTMRQQSQSAGVGRSPASRFLALPGEIRDKIYVHALGGL